MSSMMKILEKVSGLAVAPVSSDTDKQNDILCQELPFKVLEYPTGSKHNGWIIPHNWEVLKAEIKKDGKLIYDGKKHPLGVIGLSEPFSGTVSLSELKKHLYFFEKSPEDIVYHCDQYYKPYKKLWGFSVPYNLYKTLTAGDYDVELITLHTEGRMKVLEYTLQGKSPKTIIFNAHNCHAAQINDGPAGYAVLVEVMKKLSQQSTKYSYRLIIAPEHIGTVFYLASLKPKEIDNFKLGIFMEMVGNDNEFALQQSFTGESYIDKIAHHILKFDAASYWSDTFRKIVGNDESVWEAPGYEVPMISLSRCEPKTLYPQYHLSSDTVDIIKPEKLEETVDVTMAMIDVIEKNCYLKRKFTGLIALSNPQYDLYISPGSDPSIKNEALADQAKWSELMNYLPRYFDESISILDIAIKHDLPFRQVYAYLLKFKEKGLVEFIEKDLF
ncbi:MAG: hypothetical protein COT81_01960 [Candidatus Buchananbacteria bacterium CG10_big_fil_rev_8_21_14_0_10_42_9]|uniref:DUF4910 domain-containing protein n=1 Tax=Candidatus Buchananbacteria bacterium CG10_big_fil_rev_8_21_14_0_10_42_9 TaxID=1974526 RepID=A0A2H0W1R8_9BACT|nr:MAG: hypothetical protein COT81_01960 [Candidatus Buchananbacteria bacterium CG10_big_fil_rev_8_21_14_0_10_42_9]